MGKELCRAISLLGVLTLASCGGTDPEIAKREFVRSGDSYVAANKLREAVVEYRNAIQQDPRFGEARLKLADVYVKLGDGPNAYREYIRAADLLPDDVQAQLNAGSVLLLAEQFEDAQARADKVLAKNPKDIDAQILRANALASLKKVDDAVQEMEQAIRNDPDRSPAYSMLGALRLFQGNREAAETAFLKAVDAEPSSVRARLALANFYRSTSRPGDAEAQLKAALAANPKDLLVNRAFASFYITSGRVPEAEPYLKIVADLAPEGAGKLLLADYFVFTKRLDEARTILGSIARPDAPIFGAAKVRLAELELARQDSAAALRHVEEVLAKQPTNADALTLKARMLFATKQVDEALAASRAATQAAPESALAQLQLGRIQAARGESAEATAAFTQALQLDPRLAAAETALGQLHFNAGRLKEAEQFTRSSIAKAPDAADALFLLARINVRNGNLAAAEQGLTALAVRLPDFAPVQIEMGRLYLAKKNVSAARATFDKVLAKNPGNIEALSEITAMDFQANRGDAAKSRLEEAVKGSPRDASLLVAAAKAQTAQRDFAGAESSLRRAMDVDPKRTDVYGLLGQVYMAQGMTDRALKEFETLTTRAPKALGAYLMMGTILEQQNRRAEAKEVYRKALAADANAALPANNLAFMYAQDNERLDEALQLAQMAKAAMPDSPDVTDTLGSVFYKKGFHAQAVAAFRECAEKRPNQPTFQYHLGLAYAKNGDFTLARKTLEAALKMDPKAPEASEAHAALSQLADLGS